MKDIGIAWDLANGRGDWATSRQDSDYDAIDGAADGDLVAAVMVSLFTDRRASPDFVLTDGSAGRRGWWADAFEAEEIGSRLWQLERAKRTQATLLQARDSCQEALAWLQRDGLAAAVDVLTFWAGRTTLGIRIAITPANAPVVSIDAAILVGG